VPAYHDHRWRYGQLDVAQPPSAVTLQRDLMLTLGERLAKAAQLFVLVTDTPRLDAEILLAHALGISRAQLLARLRDPCDAPGFDALLKRRLEHEPIAYILSEWEFFSLAFRVTPPLFVPRPETEHLVEVVLGFIGNVSARVLELGTGTGCVAVAIAHNAPKTHLVATDINPKALKLAAENAQRHGVADRIEFRSGDLFEALPEKPGPFDVVCCNPPYVEEPAWSELPPVIRLHEDTQALLAGPDGLDVVRRLVCEARLYLRPGGLLAFEVGMGQYGKVHQMLLDNGYERVGFRRDLAGIERIVQAHAPSAER